MHREQIDNQPSSSGGKELPAGTRLEEFVIERVLGSGGFGITYLARDTSLNRQVVIKENLPSQFAHRDTTSLTVHPGSGREDQENFRWSLENFSREGEMLASLRHPGIVPVLRRFDAFGTAYFVMPFVEGVALDELINERKAGNKPFTEEELTGWLAQILDALAHLHERGIYHRDIKPGNILITNEGIPVLIDFGSARQRLSERSMTVVESAGYTPFEQLQSRGNVGPWSDLYALGATVVKVITGEAPPKTNDRSFGDPWIPLLGRADTAGRFSDGFLSGIDRSLKLPIEDRWQSAGDWKEALGSGEVTPMKRARTTLRAVGAKDSNPPLPAAKGKRWAWVAVVNQSFGFVLVVLAILACGAWLNTCGRGIFGGLVITSEPSGALVKNAAGETVGETPAQLKGLEPGAGWRGMLELEGYVSAEVKAKVVAGETKLVPPVKLVPQPQKVIVTSEPSGADVLEDGKVIGKTPLELAGQLPGTAVAYTLRIEGYEEATLAGKVKVGGTLTLGTTLNPLPKPKMEGSKAGEEKVIELAPGVNMTFCWIPAGEFMMGSPGGELGRDDDETQHRVRITKGYWMSKTEVTQAQWRAGGGKDTTGKGPGFWGRKEQFTWQDQQKYFGAAARDFEGDTLPVERLDWSEAWDWCLGMSERLGNDGLMDAGWQLALPAEAEWEYACRAGAETALHNGRNLTSKEGACRNLNEVGWHKENSEGKTHPVGQKQPNAWGLYDMHGNVWEWCAWGYGEYAAGTAADPTGPAAASDPVARGGGWSGNASDCRSADRNSPAPDFRSHGLGLRPVLRPNLKDISTPEEASRPINESIFVDDFSESGNADDPNSKSNRCFSFMGSKSYEIALKDRLLPTMDGVTLRFKWYAPKPNLIGSGSEGSVLLQFDVYDPKGNRIMYQPEVISSPEWQEISLEIQVGFDAERILVWNKWEDVEMYIDDLKIVSLPSDGRGSIQSERADKVELGDSFAFLQKRIVVATETSSWDFNRIRYAINYLYALKGYPFKGPKEIDLRREFERFVWYKPINEMSMDDADEKMSPIESENIKLLAVERNKKARK